jgi:prepilin-type processing-associated H-X9-DG protein
MSTPVLVFFAAGGNRARTGGGFAVTHFAGVGGEVSTGRGEKPSAGIFRAGKPLTKEDVTDGLSTTFAAGEIGGQYPAWGDPENLRVPQLGLNKDPRGFGNAARTGAIMLFADGHVKFFPNATDPEVLRRLSTRNAGDLTTGVE